MSSNYLDISTWCTFWTLTVIFVLETFVYDVIAQDPAVDPGTKCLKNEDYGDLYASNVYYCPDTAKPECCEVDQEFTCCEAKGSHTLRQQMILWGSVFGIVFLVAFIWICYRKDTYMCEGETLAKRMKRCCGCDKKVEPDDEVELSDIRKTPPLDNQWTNDLPHNEQDNDTYYGNQDPVTARGINPVVKQDPMMGIYNPVAFGNDSDSGRGSTTSIDGSKKTTENQGQGQEAGGIPGTQEPEATGTQNNTNSTTEKKKRKKKKNKKKKLHDVTEEDIDEEV